MYRENLGQAVGKLKENHENWGKHMEILGKTQKKLEDF